MAKTVEPKVVGAPVTSAQYVVCAIHLFLCFAIIGYAVVGEPLVLEGIMVSPFCQWVYGAFTIVSIVLITYAAVGALYLIESHIAPYWWVLLVSVIIDVFFFFVFLFAGRSCRTIHADKNHLVATLSCGVHDGVSLLSLTLLITFKIVGLFITNKCKAYIKSMYYSNYLPFIENHLESIKPTDEFKEPMEPYPSMSQDYFSKHMPRWSMANLMPSMRSMPATHGSYVPTATSAHPPVPATTAPLVPTATTGYGAATGSRHIATW